MSDLKEGEKYMKRAIGYSSASIFDLRFGPDWDGVERWAKKAIEEFRRCGKDGRLPLLEALELSINANSHIGNGIIGADLNLEAGKLCLKISESFNPDTQQEQITTYQKRGIIFFQNASRHYRLLQRLDKSADALLSLIDILYEQNDIETLRTIPGQILDLFSLDFKGLHVEKPLNTILQLYVTTLEDYPSAIDWLKQMNKIYNHRRDMYGNQILHNLNSILIITLYCGEYDNALQLWEEFTEIDQQYEHSEQAVALQALIEACQHNQEEIIDVRKKEAILRYLPRCIGVLLPKIKVNLNAPHAQAEFCAQDDDSDDKKQRTQEEIERDNEALMQIATENIDASANVDLSDLL